MVPMILTTPLVAGLLKVVGRMAVGAGPSVWGKVTRSFCQPYTIILTACLCGPSDDNKRGELSYFAL